MHETDLKGLDYSELENLVARLGEPAYRASQLASWLFEKDVAGPDAMTHLPAGMRERLARECRITRSSTAERERSRIDGTEKLLLEYSDGARIEAVVLADQDRRTGCISTQVGCRFGCAFCATGTMGLIRSLTAAEIVEQVQALMRAAAPDRLDNLVFMGMGEPMDNYDATLKAVRIINAPWGLGVGARHITISTAGLIEGIRRLSHEGLKVNLAVSLNAPTQALRETLMPIALANPLPDLIEALGEYCRMTGRMVTLEYVLLGGVNDSQAEAAALADLARGLPCKINLICYNEIENAVFAPPATENSRRFVSQLRKSCPTVVRRLSRGDDISAGCGQLRVASQERK